MKIYKYPSREQWGEIIARQTFDHSDLTDRVASLLADIRRRGDLAVIEMEERFDHAHLDSLCVEEQEMIAAEAALSPSLCEAIRVAYDNIYRFHKSQETSHSKVETVPGVECWQKPVAIDKVGLYVPGGTAPLFSTVLMLAVPARIAGCREVLLCTPPDAQGCVHPAILYAAHISGVTKVFKCGGVQAIGAMAYGTQSVPRVSKIFGPGNQYVQMAKRLVSLSDVAIDMPAGPSEVAVVADETTHPAFAAADFLSQAEHGVDSQALLFTTSEAFVGPFVECVEEQLAALPRCDFARKALDNSRIVVLQNDEEMMGLVNEYAPEHLIIQTAHYRDLADMVRNAGSVFLGPYSPESAGDYASGTNHTLPTNGYAKAYSGVNLDSFMRKITFQEISRSGLQQLGPTIMAMAEAEHLDAHSRAVGIRLQEK